MHKASWAEGLGVISVFKQMINREKNLFQVEESLSFNSRRIDWKSRGCGSVPHLLDFVRSDSQMLAV